MSVFDYFRKAKSPSLDSSVVAPMARMGSRDSVATSGYEWNRENNQDLSGSRKYTTYANMVANVSTVALAVRYMLNILGGVRWKFQPSEQDTNGKYALFMESVLNDMGTPWHRHVKKMGMYRFNGASLHEWVAKKRSDGMIGFRNLEHRAMVSISRWEANDDGLIGVVQRSRTSGGEVLIPRAKLVYLVDDGITDSYEGVGLLRHVAESSRQLQRLEQLEGYGYEMDVNGVPVMKIPYGALERQMVGAKDEEKAAIKAMIASYEKWASNHVKNPAQGLVIDSAPYFSSGSDQSPSGIPQFALEMLSSTNSSAGPAHTAIERKCREIGRVLGIEALLMGGGGQAQASVSKDKTSQLQTTMNQVNHDMASVVDCDMTKSIFAMNGFPVEMLPKAKPDMVNLRDAEALVAMVTALAGAAFREGDAAENELRDMIGLSHAPEIIAGMKLPPLDDSIDIDMEG